MNEAKTELQVKETEELKKAIAKELERETDDDRRLDDLFTSEDGGKGS